MIKKLFLFSFILILLFYIKEKYNPHTYSKSTLTNFENPENKISQKASDKMQDFVIAISDYSRSLNPDFIIIPQNGIELAFNNAEIADGLNPAYMNAIDGLGVEELFYNRKYALDKYRLSLLQQLKKTKKILVSEFVADNHKMSDAYHKNQSEGFICFVRNSDNYHYQQIPTTVPNENALNINKLSEAQNCLYLINDKNYQTKQEMLNAISKTNFDVVMIDLFFDKTEFSLKEILRLKTKSNGGHRLVISYINIGAAEKYRYYWQKDWKLGNPFWLKKKYNGYKNEFWVNFWAEDWQHIIYGNDTSYIKKIVNAGFDGAYLDNVEAYYFLYNDK